MLFIFQFTNILKKYFFWNSLNQQVLKKLENILEHFRTFLEKACHNQMDDGEKHGCQNLSDYETPQKALVWQFLDGKYDSIIVLDSE